MLPYGIQLKLLLKGGHIFYETNNRREIEICFQKEGNSVLTPQSNFGMCKYFNVPPL